MNREVSYLYRNVLSALSLLIATMAVGTLGYHWLTDGKYTWFEGFYMTFITVATIGFGEIIDMTHNTPARVFTVFLGILGAGTLSFMFSAVTVFVLETDLNGTFRRKRMEKQIKTLRGHYILCGFGRVGRNVGRELEATNRHFVAIDENFEMLEAQKEKFPSLLYLHGDGSDDDMLLRADIQKAHGVFAVTGDDSRNLMILITAKQLNPEIRVVVRCNEPRNTEKMRKAGADAIFAPDLTGGMRLASLMVRPHVVSFLDEMMKTEKRLRVEEVPVPSHFVQQPLRQLKRRSDQYVILAVRDGSSWEFNPPDEYLLVPGNILVAMTSPHGRLELEAGLAEIALG